MNIFVLFALACCVQSSYQQQNRQQTQNQISSLTYSDADFNPLPPVARPTTTTEAPESTTKKKGFFSGLFGSSKDKESTTSTTTTTTTTTTTQAPEATTKKKGFFSGLFGGSKDSTTTQQPTTTTVKKSVPSVATTTAKSLNVVTSSTVKPTPSSAAVTPSTPKVPPRSDLPTPSTPKVPPRFDLPTPTTVKAGQAAPTTARSGQPTPTTARSGQPTPTTPRSNQPTIKDDFPTLPTRQPAAGQPTPAAPSVWGTPPTQAPSSPNAWGKPPTTPAVPPRSPGQQPANAPTPPPNAWAKPPFGSGSSSTTHRPQSPSSTRKPQITSQTSSPTVGSGAVTDAELLTLSESLFSKDINNPFKLVTVNFQGRTYSSANTDEASQPLLKIDDKLFAMSTVEKMKAMFNNYEQDTAINEYVSPIEKKEEDEFIEAVLATPVMRHAMNFLQQKGVVTADPATHKELLKTIWFNLYSRGMGKIGSSGFEHVFLSEVKDGNVIGLHNWIYMSEVERTGDLDYKGWTKKIDLGNKGQIAKVRFALNGIEKPTNSLFIGTSPELELALYTVCFELRADNECRMAHGGKDFNIVTHSYRYRGKNLIGSAYPEI